MRGIDILAAFELEINKINEDIEKPLTDDSLYWLNQAVVKFVKDRFNGNAPKRTSYEQNEKRTRDLIKLLVNTTIAANGEPVEHANYLEYDYDYPTDMMFVLNEDVVIDAMNYKEGEQAGKWFMDTCVFECTADSFMYRINNKLTDFHYRFHRARPLRIRTADGFKLLTDKNYKINTYSLGYIKIPTEITSADPTTDYTDFADHTWLEIIKIAAQMYIENQADPRYRTLTNEVLTQE